MLALTSQRTSFNIVISDINRVARSRFDICDSLSKNGFTYYLIKHDKDVDNQGQLKRPHYHLVLVALKRYRVKQILNMLVDIFNTNIENIQIDENISLIASVQYLIHLNDSNKYQYSSKEIYTNNEDNLNALLLENPTTNELTTQQLIDFIFTQKMNRLELINCIGIGKYQHYRYTINDLYEIAERYK